MPRNQTLAELLRRFGLRIEDFSLSEFHEWSEEIHAEVLRREVEGSDESAMRVTEAAEALAALRAVPREKLGERIAQMRPTERARLAEELKLVEAVAFKRLMGLPFTGKKHEEKPTPDVPKRDPFNDRDLVGKKIAGEKRAARQPGASLYDDRDAAGYRRRGAE